MATKKKSISTKAKKPEPPKPASGKTAARAPASKAKAAKPAEAKVAAKVEAPAKKATTASVDLGRMKQLLERAAAETKDLEGQRTRLSSFAQTTERAFAEEAQRRAALEKRVNELGSRKDELEAQVAAMKLKLEAAAIDRESHDDRARKEAEDLRSRVRALQNERDGLRTRIKEVEASNEGAAAVSKLEKMEERCMHLEAERDVFKEKLTEVEMQLASAPTQETIERFKTNLADAEAARDRLREKMIALEAEIATIRGAPPQGAPGHPSYGEVARRYDEAEREREKLEKERDELEKKLAALKADLYARKNAPEDRDTRYCPACGTEMKGQLQSSVRIDVCPQCEGIYLDKGELQTIVAQEREYVQKTGKTSGFWGRIWPAK